MSALVFMGVVALVAGLVTFVVAYTDPGWWHLARLPYVGVHTEYAGKGRVRFISFFGGPGVCWYLRRGRGGDGRPLNEPGWRPTVYIPGFALYLRTAKSSCPPSYGKPVRRFRITRRCNLGVV